MSKFILIFNPKDNTRNDDRLDMDCYHIYECLKDSSTDYGTGAKAIRKALQGFKRISLLNANWFLYFNFSRVIDPERKRLLAIQVSKHHNAMFWSKVINDLISQLGLNRVNIKKDAEEFCKCKGNSDR